MRFIQLATFTKNWDRLGLDDNDLQALELEISGIKDAGSVIKGGGGARKIRLALPGKGKSGGVRVIYAMIVVHHLTLLLDVYAKNEKEDISAAELRERAALIEALKQELDRGR